MLLQFIIDYLELCMVVSVCGVVITAVLLRMWYQRRQIIRATKEGRDATPYRNLIRPWLSFTFLILLLALGQVPLAAIPAMPANRDPKMLEIVHRITHGVGALLFLAVSARIGFLLLKNRWTREVVALANAGKVDDAIAMLERRAAANGYTPQVYRLLASCYAKLGRWDDMLKALDEVERLSGPSASLSSDRGFAHWRAGRPNESLSFFEDAIQANPDFIFARSCYGCALVDLGRRLEAEQELDRIARIMASQTKRSKAWYRSQEGAIAWLRNRLAGGDPNTGPG